ncbi:MAG: hypothetical protein M0P30_10585 [Syntrophorhabdaceae bacterium]|nr:hypothetical protein [Syntrophorhabdaceae bacterium]HOC45204.1 hypothetical protein [Syntrophorhabdaceae bacterium]
MRVTMPGGTYVETLFIARQLTAETTSFKNDVFLTRGLIPPHEADISKLVELDEGLGQKYEPVKKEYYARLEENLSRSEEQGLSGGLSLDNKPGL